MDNDWNVSALTARSLTWDGSAFAKARTRYPRRRFEREAVAWQLASQRGGWAAVRSYIDQSADRRARRKDPNRIVELHAMIGAIGEQAILCWGFEQDAQRFDATRRKISEEHHRLVLRALSEAGGHFLLGAGHSLGNLGLRIALLDPQAGTAVRAARPKADFAPGSDDRRAWLPLSESSKILTKAAPGLRTPLFAGSRPRYLDWQATSVTMPSTPGEVWTTTGSARNLSRTPHQKGASHGKATDSSRSICLVRCSIPKLMPTGFTNCLSRPWRQSGRP